MEDYLKKIGNGRRPQIFLKMEDDLNCFEKVGQPQYLKNGRQPQKNNTAKMVVAPLQVT